MLIICYMLLLLKIGRCKDNHTFETKAVGVGQNVTLTGTRQKNWHSTNLFWIRLASGTFPEFLGGTIAYDFDVFETRRITAKQEPGAFVLHITNTQISDTAVYYCIKVRKSNMTFSKGIFLRIKGQEPDITAVTLDFPSVPVGPGDSVTLQCSVLSGSENKTCPEEHSVFWFRARSDKSHSSLIYAQGNNSDGCEKSPEALSPQKCIYSFSKNVSSSDAGTYYCAVATCGKILFGNGIKLDVEGTSVWSQKANKIIFPLCAVLALSLIVTAFLIHAIKKNNAAVGVKKDSGSKTIPQREEYTCIYSAVVFTVMKTGCGEIKDSKAAERQRSYAAVKAFGLD